MDEKDTEKALVEEENIIVEEGEDDDDIEFDDNINLEALQKQFQQHGALSEINEDENSSNEVESPEVTDLVVQPEVEPEKKEVSPLDEFPKDLCKKYVIYITPDNIDFVDNMSIDDRNRLINKVIYEQHIAEKSKIVVQSKINYTKHLIVVCLAIILSFPLLLFLVNKSLQASITNYSEAQQNFEKLYKEKGKIVNYQQLEAQE